MVQVYIEKIDKTKNVQFTGSVEGLLEKLKINPETVLVARDSELLTEDDAIKKQDKIKIMSVISGG